MMECKWGRVFHHHAYSRAKLIYQVERSRVELVCFRHGSHKSGFPD